jgi:hypothetical protein
LFDDSTHAYPHNIFPGLPNISTWGSHSHFVEVKYMTKGPIEKNVVCSNSLLCFLPYNSSPPYLCFPFFSRWYTYNKSRIKCGFCIFIIVGKVINIRPFSVTIEVCSLVSLGVGPLYIISFWLSYSQFEFLYFGCINGIHNISWIVCGWGSPWGFRNNIKSPYACRSLNGFCDVFIVLCLAFELLVLYNVPSLGIL